MKRMNFKERLKEAYKTNVGKNDTLELHGRGELLVRGCREILFYSTREIRLQLRTYILSIRGEELYCTAYFHDAVSVEGRISALEMSEVVKK